MTGQLSMLLQKYLPCNIRLTAGIVFASVFLLCTVYILACPGNYIEPGTLAPLAVAMTLYSAALSVFLLSHAMRARLLLFPFSAISDPCGMAQFFSH